jgi:hypothetical protein
MKSENNSPLLKQILQRFDKLSLKVSPTPPTTTTLAKKSVGALLPVMDVTFKQTNEPPVLSEEIFMEASKLNDEHQLIKFMTPYLRHLCAPHLVFVNSEEFPWLETEGHKQKPDGFYSPVWAIEKKNPNENNFVDRGFQANPDWYVGVIADSRLQDSISIVDCKVAMCNDDYGEHIITYIYRI